MIVTGIDSESVTVADASQQDEPTAPNEGVPVLQPPGLSSAAMGGIIGGALTLLLVGTWVLRRRCGFGRVSPVSKYEDDDRVGPPSLRSSMRKVAAAAQLGRSIQADRKAAADAEKDKIAREPYEPGKPGHHRLAPLPPLPMNPRRQKLMAIATDAYMFGSAKQPNVYSAKALRLNTPD